MKSQHEAEALLKWISKWISVDFSMDGFDGILRPEKGRTTLLFVPGRNCPLGLQTVSWEREYCYNVSDFRVYS